MPVYRYLMREYSLNYVTARQPFVPDDLLLRAEQDLGNAEADDVFALPILLDLRWIDLLAYPTEQFKLLLARRQSLDVPAPAPPCAYIVRDEGSFGMLRIFTNFAEARGYRREHQTIITTDVAEGAQWVFPHLASPVGSVPELLAEIDATCGRLDGPPQDTDDA